MIGHHGPARLRDDGGVGDSGLVADRLDAKDDIVGILLEGVVHRGLEAGPGTVIVDSQPPSHIQHLQAGSRLDEFGVDSRRLGDGFLDLSNVGHLAPQVEVQQPQAVGHLAFSQVSDGFHHFGGRQSELGAIAG